MMDLGLQNNNDDEVAINIPYGDDEEQILGTQGAFSLGDGFRAKDKSINPINRNSAEYKEIYNWFFQRIQSEAEKNRKIQMGKSSK